MKEAKLSTSGAPRATLATIAASAGVSVATVSKVLNGRADVAPTTRARVADLLAKHDYVGRRGGARAQPVVELVFDDELNGYATEIVQGALDAARGLGVVVNLAVKRFSRNGMS